MDIGYSIAKYLADNGFGTLGTDVFVDQIPADQNGVYVGRFGGSMNMYVPIEEAVLDIVCKDTSASDAITKLKNIKNFLHRMHNFSVENGYVYSVLALGNIEVIDRDSEYTRLVKLTFVIKCRDTSLIS